MLTGQRLHRQGQHAAALQAWDELRRSNPGAFLLVAADYATCARACGRQADAQQALAEALRTMPAVELLQALEQVDAANAEHRLPRLLAHLQQHPSLSAAQLLLDVPHALWTDAAWVALREAVARAAKPLQRYRCAACGFEAQHYFWQCPGCLSWDSYPPQRIDAL